MRPAVATPRRGRRPDRGDLRAGGRSAAGTGRCACSSSTSSRTERLLGVGGTAGPARREPHRAKPGLRPSGGESERRVRDDSIAPPQVVRGSVQAKRDSPPWAGTRQRGTSRDRRGAPGIRRRAPHRAGWLEARHIVACIGADMVYPIAHPRCLGELGRERELSRVRVDSENGPQRVTTGEIHGRLPQSRADLDQPVAGAQRQRVRHPERQLAAGFVGGRTVSSQAKVHVPGAISEKGLYESIFLDEVVRASREQSEHRGGDEVTLEIDHRHVPGAERIISPSRPMSCDTRPRLCDAGGRSCGFST